MKELFLSNETDTKLKGEIREVDIPEPKDDEVLIKVNVCGTNPKDWKYIKEGKSFNSGDDIAGTVAKVGSNVVEFKEGERVAAFHVMGALHGAFAEYAIAPAQTTFHIPKNISDEEAATVPLCVLTAGVAVHGQLGLPTPWHPATEPTPFLVYGGSSSNGLFALKLARASNLAPIIAIAGGSADIIKEGNYADIVIDYRSEKDIPAAIIKALDGKELHHAHDSICEHGSTVTISKAMAHGGTISGILPVKDELSNGAKFRWVYVGGVHHDYDGMLSKEVVKRDREYGYVLTKWATRALANGNLKPHPYELRDGGLNSVASGMTDLKASKVKAKKLVYKISDTK